MFFRLAFPSSCAVLLLGCWAWTGTGSASAQAPGLEITSDSEAALERGLRWLAENQGPEGNWDSNDLGLVSMGTLAFLSAGHAPGLGQYGDHVQRALDYIVRNAKPSGLLNAADPHRDMYNHGLSAFVLGQAYGISGDARVGRALDRALKLIALTQCDDGGWDYRAQRQARGHDLSLAVMQAKALRSAVDSGFEVPPEVISLAIGSVRNYYAPQGGSRDLDEASQRQLPGQFTYDGSSGTLAMAACGVVCLQEFGQYDDWRIGKSMELVTTEIRNLQPRATSGEVPWDSYTLYYVGQALYQVGGEQWRECYPLLRDVVVANQIVAADNVREHGSWHDTRHVSGKPGQLYGTSVACFILAIPNRFLPILQEGRIESLRASTGP